MESGTYKQYYSTWRYHSNGYAAFTMNGYNPNNPCGGATHYALWDGKSGETPLPCFATTGVNEPFQWPNGGYVLPTETYAMIDGNSGGGCGGIYINWTGTLISKEGENDERQNTKGAQSSRVVAVIGVGVAAAGISSWAAQAAGVTLHAARRNLPAAAVLLSEESAFPQPLPAGVSWPKQLPANLLEKGVMMEPLVPRGVVALYSRCAWEAAYVKDRDSARASEASKDLDMVANFTSLPFYAKQFDDPGEQWFADVIKATKNGNDKNLRNELSNCTYFFENQK